MRKLIAGVVLLLVALPLMAATYSTYRVAVDEIATLIATEEQRISRAVADLKRAETNLQNMTTTYGALVAEIDIQAASNPKNAGWQNLKAEKDLLVVDRSALLIDVRARLDAMGESY